MGAHESMEHAEHAEHASGSNKKIALLIAVIALFLALSETLARCADRSHQHEREASNLWAFFEAKSIRRGSVQATAEHAIAEPGGPSATMRRRRLAAEADRRLEQDRAAVPFGAGNRRRFGNSSPRAPSMPSTSATSRPHSITTTRSPRPRSRSASCWRPPPSSPA